jgi:hypothetical protein
VSCSGCSGELLRMLRLSTEPRGEPRAISAGARAAGLLTLYDHTKEKIDS